MLNEKLYNALASIYGETPKVVNEGESATLVDLHPTFSFAPTVENLGPQNTPGGEQYAINCPHCGDKRQRLYISHMWDSKFVVEGIEYHASEYLFKCFNEDCFKDPVMGRTRSSQLISSLREAMKHNNTVDVSAASLTNEIGSIANQVPYPNWAISLYEAPEYVKAYLANRGFTLEELEYFQVKYLPYYGKFQNGLLVLPVFQNSEYYFWQGRLVPLDGTPNGPLECKEDGTEYPKYYIPYGAKKSWALGNIDNAQFGTTVYVVEGLFDVYSIGKQAVCKFGRDLSRAQQNILKTKCKGKNIVLVPDMNDPEALPSAENDLIALSSSGAFKSVKIAKLPEGTDPGMIKEKGGNVCEILNASIHSQDVSTTSVFGSLA